jgi:hypothetical protein
MNTTLNQNRNFNLFIAAGIVIVLVVTLSAIITSATVTNNKAPNISENINGNKDNVALAPLSANAFPQYRQSEWHATAISVTGISGLEMYRQSERTSIPVQAGLMAYQLSERTLSPIVSPDLSSYYLSERTMTDAALINDLSEYFASERTSIPVRDFASFNEYQLSEWLGK